MFTFVADRTQAITVWAEHWNNEPKLFICKATVKHILQGHRRSDELQACRALHSLFHSVLVCRKRFRGKFMSYVRIENATQAESLHVNLFIGLGVESGCGAGIALAGTERSVTGSVGGIPVPSEEKSSAVTLRACVNIVTAGDLSLGGLSRRELTVDLRLLFRVVDGHRGLQSVFDGVESRCRGDGHGQLLGVVSVGGRGEQSLDCFFDLGWVRDCGVEVDAGS